MDRARQTHRPTPLGERPIAAVNAAVPRRKARALVLIVSLFFLWGVANNLNDVLIAHFKTAFRLSDLQSSLVQSAFYLGYFLMAAPAGLVARRYGYKGAVVTGLVVYAIGAFMFWPAAQSLTYAVFLGALFVIACGLAFLETAANPLITVLGAPSGAERRLNLAQAFNPLGSIAGVVIGRQFILAGPASTQADPRAVQGPYVVLGALVLGWAALTALTRFPPEASAPSAQDDRTDAPLGATLRALAARPLFMLGVVAQFLYVGAQVGVWSFTIRYVQHVAPGTDAASASGWLMAALVAFMAGRFLGTAAMTRIAPGRLLTLCGGVAAALAAACAFVGGLPGVVALTAVSVFMSIMYPTIFALSVRGMGPEAKLASSFLVMAVIGGAVVPAVMGRVSDMSSIASAMLVPGACFLAVAAFGVAASRRGAAARLVAP